MQKKTLANYIDGAWQTSSASAYQDVVNPATGEVMAQVPLSTRTRSIGRAGRRCGRGRLAAGAPTDRVQHLFKLKTLLEDHIDELAGDHQRKWQDVRRSQRRDGARYRKCGGRVRHPDLVQGTVSEDIAAGIDELMIRQPVGVAAIIAPFNFPGMILPWFLPYAVATGNTVIVKPSERCPMTMNMAFDLLDAAGFPPGVVNLINGGPDCVDAILDHPAIDAVSFVGSTPVARHIYARASASGKRVQAQGGAKNPIVVLPDADLDNHAHRGGQRLGTPASAAWRRPWRSPSARRATRSPTPSRRRRPSA